MSWKQYGGAKSLETNRKITTNTVVTDEIVLKNSYVGGFTINGVLDVTGKAIFQASLDVSGLVTTSIIQSDILNINNDSYLNGSVYVGIDLNTTRNIITGNTISIGNNLYVKNSAEIDEYIYFNQNHDTYLHGNQYGIGLNTYNPTSTFEISSNLINSLNIYTSQTVNRNIIAQNNFKKGIIVTADISFSHIDFFTDNKTTDSTNYDGTIICKSGGIFEIDVSKNTQIMSALSVTNRKNPAHILNETVVIYDISSRIYDPDIYNNYNSYTGNALSLISNDKKSNTSMNIITPEKSGLTIIGGAYSYDISRSMASFGLIDNCNNYLQNQIIVSGTDPVKYKTTTGINTYIPTTEKYILDINGPIHIGNGDINIVKIANFQINKMNISPSGKFLIAAGYPSNIIDLSNGSSRLVLSIDYGATWREIPFIQSDNKALFSGFNKTGGSTLYTINDIYIYDNNYAFIVCSDSTNTTPYLIWTNNSGTYWYNATIVYDNNNGFSSISNYNFIKIIVKDGPNIVDNFVNLVMSTSDNNIYTVRLIINSSNFNQYSQINRFIFQGGNINSLTYYQNNIFYFATSIGIYNNTITNNFAFISYNNYNFSEIKYSNNSIIAVGNGIIAKSTDGVNFISNLFPNINFTSLFLYNNFGFTIGNKNTVWFSKDFGNNWNPLWSSNSYEHISQSGKQFILTNPSNNFSNIVISDQNSLIVSRTDISYSLTNPSKSSVINCFLPNLLNHENNDVLDICGNMLIMGDIHIDNDGKIISNNSDFSLINENVNKVYFAGNANTIVIGNTTIGNTIIRNNLNVNLNTIISGNVSIYGQETIFNTTDSSNTSTGALIINGGVGISKTVNIGGNLFISKNSLFTGSVGVISDTSLNGNLYVNSSTQSINTTTGAVIISGGVGIGGNVNIARNTTILGNIFMPTLTTTAFLNTVNITGNNFNALYVNGSSILNSNLSVYGQEIIFNTTDSSNISTGALIINGGVGISKTVNIGGNLFISKNSLFTGSVGVISDTSLNGNLYVNSSTPSNNTTTGAVIISGGVGIGGNVNIARNTTINGLLNVISDTSLNRNLYVNSSTPSNNPTTGALIVSGGVGINGSLNIGQNINVSGIINMIGSSSIANLNNIIVTGQTESSSSNNGALIVNGGVGISKDVNIGGSLNIFKDSILYGSFNIYNDILIQGTAIVSNGFTSQKNITSIGNVFITNNTPSNSYSSGALIIGGGVGIGGNINIGGNTNIQKNLYVDGSYNGDTIITRNIYSTNMLISIFSGLSVTGAINNSNNITTTGILTVNNNTPSNSYNSGALIVNGGVSIGGNTYIQQNLNTSGSLSSNNFTTNSIYSNGTLNIGYTDDTNTSILNLGGSRISSFNIGINSVSIFVGSNNNSINNSNTTQIISIGNSEKTINRTTSQIFIGGPNDVVNIQGSLIKVGGTQVFSSGDTATKVFSQFIQYSNNIVLNYDNSGNGQVAPLNPSASGNTTTSYGAGIWINDFSINNIGHFIVSTDVQGFIFKAPTYSSLQQYNSDLQLGLPLQNIVRFDTNKLKTAPNTNGLVIISPIVGDPDQSDYTITGTSLDISNILTKNKDTIPNMQVIPTNITINNSLTVTNNTTVNGNINIIGNLNSTSNAIFNNININTQRAVTNSSLTIAGNAIISKLGIGTSTVNPNANSLEVQGNFYQTNGGYIYQF